MTLAPVWPASLRQAPRRGTFQGGPLDFRRRFTPDRGDDIVRRGSTAVVMSYDGVTFPNLSGAQILAFENWYRDDLKGGGLPFAWRDPVTAALWLWRINGDGRLAYSISHRGGDRHDLTISLIRRPGPPWWAWMIPADRTVAPKAAYDFRRGIYDAGGGPIGRPAAFTFSRASEGRYFDADGAIQVAAADMPRIGHHPNTFARRGLLVEPARTNLLTRSSEPGHTNWQAVNASKAVGSTIYYGPYAALTSTGGGVGYVSLPAVNTTGEVTFSVIVGFPGGTVTGATLFCGGAGNQYGATILPGGTWTNIHPLITSVRSERLRGGWWRASVTTSPPAWPLIGGVFIQGAVGSTVFAGAPQIEQGSAATSYIPTTSAAVARAADLAGLVTAHGLCDVRVIYDDGSADTLLSQTLVAGWWPTQARAHIAGIAVFDAGVLA